MNLNYISLRISFDHRFEQNKVKDMFLHIIYNLPEFHPQKFHQYILKHKVYPLRLNLQKEGVLMGMSSHKYLFQSKYLQNMVMDISKHI